MNLLKTKWLQGGILLCSLTLTACSSVPVLEDDAIEPRVKIAADHKENSANEKYSDPWEGFNRRMYYFNAKADQYVLLPVVDAYQMITPDFIEDGVSNFFDNLEEIPTFLNSVLQVKLGVATKTLGRFVVNSTVGVLGLFDVATPLGIKEQDEDFGQTLGYWGVGPGPYVVLPLLGPSSLRDATGSLIDMTAFNMAIDELGMKDDEELFLSFLRSVDARKNTSFRYYSSGSAFEYEKIKVLYMKYREIQIAR